MECLILQCRAIPEELLCCAFQELADANAALADIEASIGDAAARVAEAEGALRKLRIKAKTNWKLWCATHGLGDGDDNPEPAAISLPTGGVFAEAVRECALQGCLQHSWCLELLSIQEHPGREQTV